jgi:hypothetical protein
MVTSIVLMVTSRQRVSYVGANEADGHVNSADGDLETDRHT